MFSRIVIAVIVLETCIVLSAQKIPYGSNDHAGNYVQTIDAKIYYERYGDGSRPLVLLHGGLYGYIDEFGGLIEEMSKNRTVIAIATRGYGRSELGTQPFSRGLFAEDAKAVIDEAVKPGEKVDVLGFSDGAITAYILAARHPESVNRLIAIGGSLGAYGKTLEYLESGSQLTPLQIAKDSPAFVAQRKKLMADPEQWNQLILRLAEMYRSPVAVTQAEIKSIRTPTLVIAGDRDDYTRTEHFVEIYHLLPQGQLALIPGCGHVVLACKPDLVIQNVSDFLR